jgi:hypothetical protein
MKYIAWGGAVSDIPVTRGHSSVSKMVGHKSSPHKHQDSLDMFFDEICSTVFVYITWWMLALLLLYPLAFEISALSLVIIQVCMSHTVEIIVIVH